MTYLEEPLRSLWAGQDPFAAAEALEGQVLRALEGRRTLRTEIAGGGYFVKIHRGAGWREIFKNLLSGRLPVLGAGNEWRALRRLAALGVDMATAIETLWMMSKIHRDVKPANIMRRALDQTFVLLDLGLAFDVNDISLTLSGRIPGTPPYFSPEQTDVSRKRLLDFRSDLFSLGVVLYEVTTGEHPFWKRGMAYGELVEHIRGLPARKPSELRPEAPAELDAVILRLLAKTPHMRYRSCSLLRKSLMEIQRSTGV